MNHCVPDLEMDDHYSNILTSSSGLTHSRKLSSVNNRQEDDDIMELLWHNGQVVMQSQNQRSCLKKSPPPIFKYDAVIPTDTEPRSSQLPKEHESASHSQCHNQQHLFIEEDEMAAWLHYPLVDDQSFTADLLYPPPATTTTTTTSTPPVPSTHNTDIRPPETSTVQISRPPLHAVRREVDTRLPNFGGYFSRLKTGLVESGPSSVVKESTTVVDSSEMPAKRRMTEDASNENFTRGVGLVEMTSSGGGGRGKEVTKCEKTVTSSSPGGSSATAEPTPTEKPFVEERKRKGIEEEEDETECQSEDGDFQYGDAMKQERATSSTKRTRAAEVHNLSERRRRDRINEKLKALQELIPRCNKSDKASMLDEAIEYLKSLQLQIQMMSMGCAMVPMMFPGVQQYMPPMGMGMGMGLEMGMNQPLMSFPNVLAGPALPTSGAANHLWPRFPMPAFHIPPAPATVPSRMQARIQSDYMPNSVCTPYPNQSRIPNFPDPYQQYIGSHQQAHWPLHQYQTMVQPNSTKPSTSRGAENHENSRSG